MNTQTVGNETWAEKIPVLLRGEMASIQAWLRSEPGVQIVRSLIVITLGSAAYGTAIGWWRDPVQAGYTAVKFPLIVMLTALGNALLNGMLASLLGLSIGFRQSLLAILLSFTLAAVILGAFSPLVFFLVLNTPPISGGRSAAFSAHSIILLTNVAVIALAGILANVRLYRLLLQLSGERAVARRILVAWLGGNLLLGSQLSWLLRPFVGSPQLPVEFFRADAMQGNFFEAVGNAVKHLFMSH